MRILFKNANILNVQDEPKAPEEPKTLIDEFILEDL